MDTYNSQLSGEEVAKASRQFREARVTNNSIAPVGWGDGGGGTTREMTGKARRLANLEGSATVKWEHPNDFFDRAQQEMPSPPVWVGELYLELHRATLTSQHQTKQGNRRTEQLLVEAELWAATASIYSGTQYPYEQIDSLWQTVLLHQFHDILPGTSIAWVHREVVARYAQVIEQAQTLIAASQQALAGSGAKPLTFNAAPYERSGLPFGAAGEVETTSGEAVNADQQSNGYLFENSLVRIFVTSEGLITSAVDLSTGRDAIAQGQEANLLQLHQDFPNMWDAWDVDKYYRNQVTDLRELDSIQLSHESGGSVKLSIVRSFSKSKVVQELVLAPGSRTLQITQSTDWHEAEKFLKVAFPLDIRAEHTIAETQFGYHQRVTHVNTSWEAAKFETSMHRFVLAQEPGFGAALINDSIYGFDVTRDSTEAGISTTLRLSLLRAPRFPDPHTDQGLQTHRYGLVIGTDIASATEAGALLNSAERVISGAQCVDPLVRLEGEGLVVSSVKLASDQSGDLVVRVYESLGRRARGTLQINTPFTSASTVTLLEEPSADETTELADDAVQLALGAFEVRTVRFKR
jgi:alpha-mannosidase